MENETKNNEIIEVKFDLIENEADKNTLINNLGNYNIFKIDESNSTVINIVNFSDSVVKVASELFKDGLILEKTSKLFKCDTSINSLMKFTTGGYGSAIMKDGKISEHAKFFPVGGDISKVISPFLILQIASVALGQYFMYQINEKLGEILNVVKEISMKMEYEKMAELKTIISEILVIENKKTIDKNDISILNDLKIKAKDIFNYYEIKIKNTTINEIDFGNKKRFKSRIEELLKNIGEFDLNYYMYKASFETLISIYALLYKVYAQNNDFENAENIFDILKQYDKLFDNEISSKLKDITNKILNQFDYIQKNKDWIPDTVLKVGTSIMGTSMIVLNPIFLFGSFLGGKGIYNKIISGKDFTKEHIEKYSKLKKEINNNISQVIKANMNFIQNMERKNTIYYAEINNDKYALIENNTFNK